MITHLFLTRPSVWLAEKDFTEEAGEQQMMERKKIMAKIKLKEDCEGPGKLSPTGVSQCQSAR